MEIFCLSGICKSYPWGKRSERSAIVRFLDSDGAEIPEQLAEIWFGIHPNGTARVSSINHESAPELKAPLSSSSLQDVCRDGSLSFLAKILSVDNILSLQLHPDSEQAIYLHKTNPKEYPDSSAKPEMGIAISPLTLLCGFKSQEDCWGLVSNNEGFKVLTQAGYFNCLKENDSFDDLDLFRNFIRELLELPSVALESFAKATFLSSVRGEYDAIALKASRYLAKYDPGIVLLYLLELCYVKPGEAIYIAPGVPHAYVSGDLFECMKCSDNVVRGGLTGKFVDREMFSKLFATDLVNYNLPPVIVAKGVKKYSNLDLPFVVHSLSGDLLKYPMPSNANERIFLVVEGEGIIQTNDCAVNFKAGDAFFLRSQGHECLISGNSLVAFQVEGK